MALNLSGTSGITGAGIGTIGPSGANVTGVVTCTSVGSSGDVSGTTGTFTGEVTIPTWLVHAGDTNTKFGFEGTDTIAFETAGSERLRISSAGNFGFGGQTSPASLIHIEDLTDDGYELKLNGNSVQFNRTSLSYIDQLNDTGSLVFRTTSSYTERMRIASGGDVTITTGNLVIGTAGKGIDFSATTNTSATGASTTSELLDDYEEGTFALAATSDATMTSSNGTYTRIGRFVCIKFHFQINQINSGSTTHLTGLPFTAIEQGYGSSGYFNSVGNFNSISPYATGNTVYFNVINTNNSFAQNPSILGNSSRVDGSIVYTTS